MPIPLNRLIFGFRSLKTHQIMTELEMPLPIEGVFNFFSQAENLERITPPELAFEIISNKPVLVSAGSQIEYRLSLYGIRFKWKTRIQQWIPGIRFIDEQIRGPYKLWQHVHTFKQVPDGTLIHDLVTYALPLFPFGELVLPLVRPQLRRIFRYRQLQVIKCMKLDPGRCRWRVHC